MLPLDYGADGRGWENHSHCAIPHLHQNCAQTISSALAYAAARAPQMGADTAMAATGLEAGGCCLPGAAERAWDSAGPRLWAGGWTGLGRVEIGCAAVVSIVRWHSQLCSDRPGQHCLR